MSGGDGASASNPLTWRLLRRLRTALPFRASHYVGPQSAKVLQVAAAGIYSQPEFLFFQLTSTLATLSKRLVVNMGPNSLVTHPNVYTNFEGPPKSGKTNAHIYGEGIRKRLYAITGINNEVTAGTTMGLYYCAVQCAKHGGLPLHAPDEGLASVNKFLDPQAGTGPSFCPEVFLSSGWSGADVARSKATTAIHRTENTRLTILAMGTLADIGNFHRICRTSYADRGLVGRFLTAFAPAYSTRCPLPHAANAEEASLLALSATDLSQLLENALLALYRQAEAPTFQGLRFSDEAIEMITDLRSQELAKQNENDDDLHWSELLANRLHSYIRREFRLSEMTEKWALLLHLFDVLCASINFVEGSISEDPLPVLIERATVERAQQLVQRAQDQDAYYVQLIRISTTTRQRETIYIMENVDFILYKCLQQILLIWPGPLVTSESFRDRCAKLSLTIPYDEIVAAGQALAAIGSVARETPTARISCAGILQQTRVPRQSFRFYKVHPDLVSLELLAEMSIDLVDYTTRYHMDYFQLVDAQTLRTQRSERKFNEWVNEIPNALLPPEESAADVPTSSSSIETASSVQGLPEYPKFSKYQHEAAELRFGPALRQRGPVKRRRSSPTPSQHVYRLPGMPTFTNHSL